MHRRVFHLKWARKLDGWPDYIPKSRARGRKALGTRYESAVARTLGPSATRGQWWEYSDANGIGVCQTDIFLDGANWVAVFECKHTWTEEGMTQLGELYLPVVEMACAKRALGVQICKNLVPWYHGSVYTDLFEAVEAAKGSGIASCHWRGAGLLIQPRKPKKEYLDGHV